VRLLFQCWYQSTRPRQCLGKVIYAKEEKQPVARLCSVRPGKRRMLVVTPPMKAEQDGPVRVENLPEIVMRRLRGR
jgi:hypothetical protein